MPETKVYKAYDDVVANGGTVQDDITTESYAKIGILSVMDNASAAGDIGVVTLKMYDGDKPRKLVDNLPLNSSYTLGPTLVGTVTQKFVVYDCEPFVEVQFTVANAAGAARNLEIFVFKYMA